jgi:hypothetical protein
MDDDGEPHVSISFFSTVIDEGLASLPSFPANQARPGHPVFLDAVGRTLRKTEGIMREESEAKAKGETYMPDSALGT